jgi:hypothetical protein
VIHCFKELLEIIGDLVVHMSSQVTCKCNIFPPKEDAKNKNKIVSAAINILANTQYS